MIKVVVGGATGKLGSLVCSLVQRQEDMELIGAIVSEGNSSKDLEILPGVMAFGPDRLPEAVRDADVYVDLTSPQAAQDNLPRAARKGLDFVIGTTGIAPEAMDAFEARLRSNGGSAVVAPNFSVGVNVFFKTCRELAKALPGYDVEIVEVHHNKKRDAPSGTARSAAEIIAQSMGAKKMIYGREGNIGPRGEEICIHSLRSGDVVGEHTVIFAGRKERIELTHRAHSREAFAEGCVLAIRWIAGRDDGRMHTMSEVLDI
ncbi:MAG: 4-hydroxy-tetrahydrodipicolinate reductase [Euryarchaeota archaeon]|nr:4-hydroxy-tetrahydrodipicolinate reductase [Euryarchaeota archaeon]